MTSLPKPRGPLGVAVLNALVDHASVSVPRIDLAPESPDDAALTLWILHELSYGGFDEVDDRAEGEPELAADPAAARGRPRGRPARAAGRAYPTGLDLAADFFDWVADQDGPSLAKHVQAEATEEQVLDLLRVRSVYHLKEADPTTWVDPAAPGCGEGRAGGAAVRRVRRR